MIVTTKYGKNDIGSNCFQVLLVANDGRPIVMRYISRVSEVPFLTRGNILIWNWETSIFHIHQNLDTAIRSCVHTQGRYGRDDQRGGARGELIELSVIVARHGILWDMVGEWRELSPARRKAYTEASLATADLLRNSRNKLRAGMAERAVMASTIFDSLGRVNLSRTEALQATVRDHAKRRAVDARSISVRVDRRMSVLLDEREKNLDLLRQLTFWVAALSDSVDETAKSQIESLLLMSADSPFEHFFSRCLLDDLMPACRAYRSASSRPRVDAARRLKRLNDAIAIFWHSRSFSDMRMRLAKALSRRPRNDFELATLRLEFEALLQVMKSDRDKGLDKTLRNSPLPRAIRHLELSLLEWQLGDFPAMVEELDRAEAPF
ncbi:MAG: hypothetical protein UX09_C0007G0007 [Candidatus Uhrbacteria bacterium GW2011_GWE2_45_35]|uniref:Uncharacterized protein n=2 Tax=Candidatus Uhriibacteriota TaxID=1752732 RepID=A0A0G1JGB3_9BACT|nr:MAG: hypothetical protein UW63_C0027G0006 [Candidatus Uhrbacteria bacterium GW2011_GWF2_44_350]KKU08981.1 MAG: hypothetical protein UX09_C0007G0007 [Candidatus Uhrbacteria bacterium GW2011_GWE2_45_35]HBR81069.1 hypothetical protein [Candidatus Uhrbacteria bacterium]HCU31259.1 hypothetical protein [Candidatus Uhrbacteria bacterium]